MRELLFIVLVLACPAMMILMMRGGHADGGHAHDSGADEQPEMSTESLHRLRADIDVLIAERERGDNPPLFKGARG